MFRHLNLCLLALALSARPAPHFGAPSVPHFGAPSVPHFGARPAPPASPLGSLLNARTWDSLFPHRNALYTFDAFHKAASRFPDFLAEQDPVMQRRELAAFLANIAQETSGGWPQAPGGYFAWGLYFTEEIHGGTYADTSKHIYPPVPGQSYFGRGPVQLSWNYNYGQFSQAWFGDKTILLNHPETLTKNGELAFASALWFWMTTQPPKPSCHDVMSGAWSPTPNDSTGGRVPGFGATVNIFNGGVECGKETMSKTQYRYDYYLKFCTYFHVSPGPNVSCAGQRPFGQ
jgi:hypothetical protein